jgi:tetratricopeptide (TPR) repeat protein
VATTDGKVEAALAEAADHMNRRDLPRARAAATRALELLESGASDHWKGRVDELLTDLDLVAQIYDARQLQGTFDFANNRFPREKALPRYAEAFARYGIRAGDDPGRVVTLITQRPAPVQEAVVTGLDNWWLIARDHDATTHDWLGAVLQAADADGWRAQVRRAVAQKDRRPLEEIAGKEDLAVQSPAAVSSLTWALLELRAYDTVIALLRPAQRRYPNDVWINLDLAYALVLRRPANMTEALRFYSIAWALRPEQQSPGTYINLGRLLIEQNDWDGAIFVSRKLLELQPDSAEAYNHLGMGLAGKGNWQGAEAAYRKAIELKPDDGAPYCNFGKSLLIRGQADEAASSFREAVRLRPNSAGFHFNLGNAEYVREDFDAALAAYDKAIAKNPDLAVTHLGRGNALVAKSRLGYALHERLDVEQGRGNPQAVKMHLGPALAAYERAVRLDPTLDRAHSSLGMVWLLIGDTDRAVAACGRAVELNPNSPSNHCNLGRALEAAKARDDAVASYQEAIRLDRDYAEAYCHLHRVLRDTGRFTEALAAIEEGHRLGSARPRWRLQSLAWLKETRQYAGMEAKLPRILNGSEKPATFQEQLSYAWVCQVKGLCGASARLYAGAFAANPTVLANPLATRVRYRAAQAAAPAGTAEGRDEPKLDAAERARWRQQALDWLRADLTLLEDRAAGSPNQRAQAQSTLQYWWRDKTLAGIREPEELAKLPEPERADYIRFWADVQEVLVRCMASAKGR